MEMFEVTASMAGLQLAMEIAPSAESPPKPAETNASRQAQQPEGTFRRVLARLEQRDRPKLVNHPRETRKVDKEKPNPASTEVGEGDSPNSTTGGEVVTASAESSRDNVTPSEETKPVPVLIRAVEEQISASYARSGFDGALALLLDELPVAPTAVYVPGTEAGNEGIEPNTATGGEARPSAVLPNPTPYDFQAFRPEVFMRPGDESIEPARAGPAPGTSPAKADEGAQQFGRAVFRLPELPKAEGKESESVTPAQDRRPPGPEWTGVLELSRLLKPITQREPVLRERSAEPEPRPPDEVIWQPRPRSDAAEMSRQPQQSRFSHTPPAQPAARQATDQLIWRPFNRAETVQVSGTPREPFSLASNAFRPPLEGALQATAGGGTAEATSMVQGAPRAPLAPASHRIDPEMLVADVRQAVIRLTADGQGVARMVLHPPELGELIVRLESAKNGVVRAEFHTFSPLVREALEAGLTRLTEALEAEGLTLAQAEVHLDLHLGAEGQNGEAGFESADGAYAVDRLQPEQSVQNLQDIQQAVERLPEGATISIYA
jgi:hypothetical protein